jgi:hypothetical protein
MIEYSFGEKKYGISYQHLKMKYEQFVSMTDSQFLLDLPNALHLACIICYLKEEPNERSVSDVGIIHELVHLMCIPDITEQEIKEARELFKTVLQLA